MGGQLHNRRIHSDAAPGSPEYVEAWARDLIAAIGKGEARRILVDYRALADNKRLAKVDRETAAERVEALDSLL